MRKTYQGTQSKSNRKFEVLGNRELLVQVPLPMAEVWEELQAQVEQLTGQAGLRIIGTLLEDEVARRVGPPHRPMRRRAQCVGAASRVMSCLGGRKWGSNDPECARAKAKKSRWIATPDCSTTEGGSGPCGKASWPG